MAVTELIFPALKPSLEDRETFKRTWPTLSKTFESHPDVRSGFYGWVVEENGKDVRGDWTFVLLLGTDSFLLWFVLWFLYFVWVRGGDVE